MRFRSTRGACQPVSYSRAIFDGLAPDGGLYVPERWSPVDPAGVGPDAGFAEIAARVIEPWLAGDPLAPHVDAICEAAFDFPLRLEPLDGTTAVLELFHGPTAAFKDFGARFLAECMGRSTAEVTILVATSGDTGGAVAAAFHRKPGVRVAVLFPRDGVSPLQERQLTGWGDNVRAFAVAGTFDDCQRMVKQAFADPEWRRRDRLTSANSINIGRLMPQAAYYAAASLEYHRRTGRAPGFIVPTGNLGNAFGAFWARRMGWPVGPIALATNANRTIVDWLEDGRWRPRPSVRTLANAMDVGDPSNIERLLDLHPEPPAEWIARVAAFDDDAIRAALRRGPDRWGRIWCPHTATAAALRETLGGGDWILVATAHPGKFREIVEPEVGRAVELPASLASLERRTPRVESIDADAASLERALRRSA